MAHPRSLVIIKLSKCKYAETDADIFIYAFGSCAMPYSGSSWQSNKENTQKRVLEEPTVIVIMES